MKTRAILAGAVALAALLVTTLLLTVPFSPPQKVTVRHVKSVQSGDVTTMTFEVTNHTADPYVFHPFEVQVRKGNDWTRFEGFDITKIHPHPTLAPHGVASYSVNATNLPAGCVVRFSIRPQKVLLGVDGLVRRAELNLRTKQGGRFSLNPYDKNSSVFGSPTVVVCQEWVETGK